MTANRKQIESKEKKLGIEMESPQRSEDLERIARPLGNSQKIKVITYLIKVSNT